MPSIARDSRDRRRTRREIVEEAVKVEGTNFYTNSGNWVIRFSVRVFGSNLGRFKYRELADAEAATIRRGLEQLLDELDG